MRHRKHTAKLGRKGSHRNAMLANLVCSLIKFRRVTTTLAKAKAARPMAEKMLTLGKKGTIHHRRLAAARLHQEDAVRILFNEIAPQHQERQGGYTRIIKQGTRRGDAAPMAILEWVVAEESGGEPKETGTVGTKQSETVGDSSETKAKSDSASLESATEESSKKDKKK